MTDWSLSQRFPFEGDEVAYDVMGAGEPLVLVHGTPFSSYVWHSIARELARGFRVHLFDLLGYGQSTMREGQDVSLGVQNRVLAALLDHWGLDRPKVLAHDFGGATSLRAHLLDGCDYERLLLIDPVAIRPWGSPFVQHTRRHEEAFASLPPYLHEALLTAYLRSAVHRDLSDDALEPYRAPWRGPIGQPAFYRQIVQMELRYTDEVEPQYGDIRCPVALLWGEEDAWIPLERGEALQAMIPGATLQRIPGSGHLMQEDVPEAIVAAALRFFA